MPPSKVLDQATVLLAPTCKTCPTLLVESYVPTESLVKPPFDPPAPYIISPFAVPSTPLNPITSESISYVTSSTLTLIVLPDFNRPSPSVI